MASASLPSRRLSVVRRVVRGDAAVWSAPAVVLGYLVVLDRFPGLLTPERVSAALLALGLVAVAARHPARALAALIVLLPLQLVLQSALLAAGASPSLVESTSAVREALAIGVVLAAVKARRRNDSPRLDALDLVAFGYLALLVSFAVAPTFFATSAPTDLGVRLDGLRSAGGFVVLLLAARHLRLPPERVRGLLAVALGVAVVLGVTGLVEYMASGAWNTFAVDVLGYPDYAVRVQEVLPATGRLDDVRVYTTLAGVRILRIGSVLFNPITGCFLLITGAAVACERLASGRGRAWTAAGLAAAATAVLLTQTRSAVLALAVAGLIVLVSRRATPMAGARERFAIVLLVGVVALIPVAVSTGLTDRVGAAAEGTDPSSQRHVDAVVENVGRMLDHPAGEGLGTAAGAGQRGGTARLAIAENHYVQTGNETGILGFVLFCSLTVLLLRRTRRLPAMGHDFGAVHAAACGLAVAALLLHVWNVIAVAWTLWGLAGAAIGASEGRPDVAEPTQSRATVAAHQAA